MLQGAALGTEMNLCRAVPGPCIQWSQVLGSNDNIRTLQIYTQLCCKKGPRTTKCSGTLVRAVGCWGLELTSVILCHWRAEVTEWAWQGRRGDFPSKHWTWQVLCAVSHLWGFCWVKWKLVACTLRGERAAGLNLAEDGWPQLWSWGTGTCGALWGVNIHLRYWFVCF